MRRVVNAPRDRSAQKSGMNWGASAADCTLCVCACVRRRAPLFFSRPPRSSSFPRGGDSIAISAFTHTLDTTDSAAHLSLFLSLSLSLSLPLFLSACVCVYARFVQLVYLRSMIVV